MDLNGLNESEKRIVTLARNSPKGISQNDVDKELSTATPAEKATIINKLLMKFLLDAVVAKDGSLLYMAKDNSKTKGVKLGDNEEKIVYSLIEAAGNKGIWSQKLKTDTNLKQTQLNKILKSLKTRELIKQVSSVADGKKKIFMLYNLEPDETVSGGAWYQDQDFDEEFVNILNQECYIYLERKRNENVKAAAGGPIIFKNSAYCSTQDILDFITNLGICKIELKEKNIEQVLNTLIYDGKVERYITTSGKFKYRAMNPLLKPRGLINTPCGVCPVKDNCDDLGDVSPLKCEYINDWLN